MSNPEEQFFTAYRTGLEGLANLATTMLGEAERLRTRQLEAIREAMTQHAELCKGITAANCLNDLLAAQARFANHQFELAFGFWSRHLEAAGHGQREVLRRIEEQAAQMNEGLGKMLEGLPPGAEPVSAAIKSLMQAGYAAFGMGAQATEQAVRLTESQIATATAGIRDTAAAASQKTA